MRNEVTMNYVERAAEIFCRDVYATGTTGIVIEEVEAGRALVSLKVDGRHLNASGSVMGGVYYTMADFAFAVAANFDRPLTVTLTSSISYLSAAKGMTLFAEARCVKEGRSAAFYEVNVTDELGTAIARVQLTGHRRKPRFAPSDMAEDGHDPYREIAV